MTGPLAQRQFLILEPPFAGWGSAALRSGSASCNIVTILYHSAILSERVQKDFYGQPFASCRQLLNNRFVSYDNRPFVGRAKGPKRFVVALSHLTYTGLHTDMFTKRFRVVGRGFHAANRHQSPTAISTASMGYVTVSAAN